MNLEILGKNTLVYSVGTVALRAAAFIQIPIFTHYLLQAEYGFLSTLLFTVQILIFLIDMGLRSGMMRFMSSYENENRLNALIGSMIFLNAAVGTGVLIITLIFAKPVFNDFFKLDIRFHYVLLTCLVAIGQSLCLNIMSVFRARNQGSVYMAVNLATAVALILGTLVFLIVLKMGIAGILISQFLIYFIVWLGVGIYFYLKICLKISGEISRKLLQFGFPLVFGWFGPLLMTTAGVYFLGEFSGYNSVAIYSLSWKISQIVEMSVTLPFQMAYEPFVFQNLHTPDIKKLISRLATYYLFLFAVGSFFVNLFFRSIIHVVAPPEYNPAWLLAFLFVPGSAALGFHYIGQSLLHVEKKTHITGGVVFGLSMAGIPLNYFFIQHYGIYGLIGVQNFILISMAAMLVFKGLKVFPVKFELRRLFIIAFAFAFLLTGTYIMKDLPPELYYPIMLCAAVLTGIVLYYSNILKDTEKNFIYNMLNFAGQGSSKNSQ